MSGSTYWLAVTCPRCEDVIRVRHVHDLTSDDHEPTTICLDEFDQVNGHCPRCEDGFLVGDTSDVVMMESDL